MLRYCATDTDLFSYALFYAAALLFAIVVAFVFYFKIYLVLRKSTLSKALIIGRRQSTTTEETHALADEVKIVKTSFKIFILFFITWLPLALLLMFHMGDIVPSWVYLYAALSAHGNSTLNFIMYFMENDQFRRALKEIMWKAANRQKIHDLTKTGMSMRQRTSVVEVKTQEKN